MTGERDQVETVLEDQTLVIHQGRIQWMGDSEEAAPIGLENIVIVDGEGSFVLPGLIDMHAHVMAADLPSYVSHGITSARNLWGYPNLLNTMRLIEEGELVGPSIYSLSPGLDGSPPVWPYTELVLNPSHVPAVIDRLMGEGWIGLKVYDNLLPKAYDAIAAEARSRNIPFGGHVPWRVGLFSVLAAKQDFIEHLSGYSGELGGGSYGAEGWGTVDVARMPELAEQTAEAGTWNCPTLALFKVYASRFPGIRDRIIENRRAFVLALWNAEAGLLIGTDSGINVVSPGRSLHDEMAEFLAAGLTTSQVLRTATRTAAEFLGQAEHIGTIETGKQADLIVTSGNPLLDLRVLVRPTAVMLRGRWAESNWSNAADTYSQDTEP